MELNFNKYLSFKKLPTRLKRVERERDEEEEQEQEQEEQEQEQERKKKRLLQKRREKKTE